jgi:hypothetical protein
MKPAIPDQPTTACGSYSCAHRENESERLNRGLVLPFPMRLMYGAFGEFRKSTGVNREARMSNRHRNLEAVPTSRAELRAHARGERHRISTELHSVATAVASGGLEPDDADEPGAAWKPEHHHDADRAKAKLASSRRRLRHWKLKSWKRRTAERHAKAQALRLIMDEA